jgi:hypothetical protein
MKWKRLYTAAGVGTFELSVEAPTREEALKKFEQEGRNSKSGYFCEEPCQEV